jgi:hypothetical protein
MRNRLTDRLGGGRHWLDMLGGDTRKVNVRWHFSSGQMNQNRHIEFRIVFLHVFRAILLAEFLDNRRDSILIKQAVAQIAGRQCRACCAWFKTDTQLTTKNPIFSTSQIIHLRLPSEEPFLTTASQAQENNEMVGFAVIV